jgi:probable rRNA maturation factor
MRASHRSARPDKLLYPLLICKFPIDFAGYWQILSRVRRWWSGRFRLNVLNEEIEPEPTTPGPAPAESGQHSTQDRLAVDLILDGRDVVPPAAGWIEPLLVRAMQIVDIAEGSITMQLLDDEPMAELHERYHNDPTTTDVITFDLSDGPGGLLEGDLALGREVAEREAAKRGHEARVELLLYAVHGLLHLVGEDDRTPEAFEQMHQRENKVLTELGFADVFERGSGKQAVGDEPALTTAGGNRP